MEGVKAKQSHDALHLEVSSLKRNLKHASTLMDLYNQKTVHLEDQLRGWSERMRRLSEDGMQRPISLGNSQRKLSGLRGEAPKLCTQWMNYNSTSKGWEQSTGSCWAAYRTRGEV